MNIKILHGRLVRDPEFTKDDTDEKKNRCKFTVATDRQYGDEADFHDCIIFGKRAAVVDKYFRKGSEIVLFGEDQGRSYEDKNGVKRKAWTVVVHQFDFCGSKSDGTAPKSDDIPDGFKEQEADIPF